MVVLRIFCHLSAKKVMLHQHLPLCVFLTSQSEFFYEGERAQIWACVRLLQLWPGVRFTKYGCGFLDAT